MNSKDLLEKAAKSTQVLNGDINTKFLMPIDSTVKKVGYVLCAKFKKAILEHYKFDIGDPVRVFFNLKETPSVEAIPYDTTIKKIGSSCGIIFEKRIINQHNLKLNDEIHLYLTHIPKGDDNGRETDN